MRVKLEDKNTALIISFFGNLPEKRISAFWFIKYLRNQQLNSLDVKPNINLLLKENLITTDGDSYAVTPKGVEYVKGINFSCFSEDEQRTLNLFIGVLKKGNS